jgi:glycosyltransferase involved in cell wall biosynthesis
MGIGYSPSVSIITPVFNGLRFIEQCIQSVLSQDYPYIEHVIIDGGSTDGTLDIIKGYNKNYPERIRFVSEPDKGACDAWNKGWSLSKGEILGWLGADDLYELNAITSVVEFFRTNTEAYFVFGKCNLIDDKGKKILVIGLEDFDIDRTLKSCANPIPAPTAFYRREVIQNAGFLSTDVNCCDFDYWIRVGKIYEIYRIDEVLASFRIHKGSTSGSRNSYRTYAKERYRVVRRYGGGFSLDCSIGYLIALIMDTLKYVFGSRLIYYRFTYTFKNLLLSIRYYFYGGRKG